MKAIPCIQVVGGDCLVLKLYIQPRASKNQLVGLHGDALKLRLTTPPVDGKANKALLVFLSKIFKVSQSSFSIKSGKQGRRKVICIDGVGEQYVRDVLTRLLPELSDS